MAEPHLPTHVVPQGGIPAWRDPDGSVAPVANLAGGLDVSLAERRGEWARVVCSNGWTGWVDGRRLTEMQPAPSPPPPSRTPTPTPTPTPAARPTPTPGPAPTPAPQAAAGGQDPRRTVVQPGPGPVPSPTPTPTPTPEPTPAPTPAGATPSTAWGAPGAGAPQPTPGPAAPAWGAPGAPIGGYAATARRARFGVGQIIAVIGAGLFLVSPWLNWLGFRGENLSGYQIPGNFLLDSHSGRGGISLGIVVLVFAALGISAAFLSASAGGLRWLPIVTGVIAIAISLLYIYRVNDATVEGGPGVGDLIKIGVYIAIVGAAIQIIGGAVSLTQKR